MNLAHEFVSRRHCKFLYRSDGIWIEDLDSSNGTYVDGRRLSPDERVEIDPTSTVTLAEEIEITWDMVRSFKPDDTPDRQAAGGPSHPKTPERKSPQKPKQKSSSFSWPWQSQDESADGSRSKPQKKDSPPERKDRSTPLDSPAQQVNVSVNTSSDESKEGSLVAAIFMMAFVSLLLFWLPFFGPVIAGYAGGKKAGGVGKAVLASLLPAGLAGVLVFVLAGSISGIPVLGVIAGAGAGILALFHVGPLLLGAIVGGASA